MLTPEQIHRRARNRYVDFLRSLCTGAPFFPLTVFGAGMVRPRDFATDRAAIDLLHQQSKEQTGFGYEITWTERNFRRWGMQKIPRTVSYPTQQDYLRALGRQAEVRHFQADYELIRMQRPELEAWAQAKPLEVVNYAGRWQKLLDVCTYLRENPRPGCYIRELPIAVETKFVENHMGILNELLPLAAPGTVIADCTRFEARFGFRYKQPLIRMRFLDPGVALRSGFPVCDMGIPLDGVCNLPLAGVVIVIVENEMTFLTLPALPGTVAIFGAGDAAASLITVEWLAGCPIIYWGDLDSHGFETLSCLRRRFPNVGSLMMDETTYSDHQNFAVDAAQTRCQERLNLAPAEQALYDRLVEAGKLLEQEHIPNAYSQPRLRGAVSKARVNGVFASVSSLGPL
jgi:hypothetical protein